MGHEPGNRVSAHEEAVGWNQGIVLLSWSVLVSKILQVGVHEKSAT